MASNSNRRVPAETILADREILVQLQSLPDYQPANEAYSLTALQQLAAELDRAEEAEVIARRALKVAQERVAAARFALHEAMLGAKTQVIAQYGDNSPALHAVGRKQKSEYRRPARRKPPMA